LPVHAQTGKLGVKVGKVTPLKKGVITEADARDDIRSAKRDLFNFWEKFFWGTIQNQLPDFLERNEFFGPDFGCVKNVEIEVMFLRTWNNLNAEPPLGESPALYGFIQVFPMEVWQIVKHF
jgi:hypothetical protein